MHAHHNLNLSDHLPLSISIKPLDMNELQILPEPKINWDKASEDCISIPMFNRCLNALDICWHLTFSPLLNLNEVIMYVSKVLKQAVLKQGKL